VAKAFLGTNASFGPDSMKTRRSAIFLGGQVALTFGSTWKPRIVLEYNTDVNLFERQVHIALLSLQFGASVFTPKTIVKDVRTQTTDETVKKVTVEKTVEKQVIKENVRFLLDSETVNFETDKAILLRRSETFLRELGRILAQYPDRWSQLTIEGHTDIRGSAEHNNKLSLARASAVRDALVKSGVQQSRIRAVGFGFNRPLDPNNNEIAWARNRRVELSFEGVRDARWLREVLQKLKSAVSSLPR
jgi:outer membrane protein OmpA-like peptidoglycan-associated protein